MNPGGSDRQASSPEPAPPNLKLAAALSYARRGWPVFPVHSPINGTGCSCRNASCTRIAKHPRTQHGLKDATTDEATIRRWWTRWPDANVGIATGRGSGVFVLDIDPRDGGDVSLENLEREHGDLPETVEVLTGGGGRHLYFRHPGDSVAVITKAGIFSGVDVRGDGGYIIAPPSGHASGRQYLFEASSTPDEIDVAQAPRWLLDRVLKKPDDSKTPSETTPTIVLGNEIPEGQRNDTLMRIAGAMRRRGATEDAIRVALLEQNKLCAPPLTEIEIAGIARNISRYDPKSGLRFPLTEVGNRDRLVAHCGDDLRFCQRLGWFVWDGRHWKPETTGEVMRRAEIAVRLLYAEAAAASSKGVRRAISHWVAKSETWRQIEAMVALARHAPGIAVDATLFDADPWVLNCPNGTVDLRTGTLRPHRRGDLLTGITAAEFDPDARLETWDQFLLRIFPFERVRAFVQRAAGYSIIGATYEECLFFAHGEGATGKSTFLGSIREALGSYGHQADFSTFLASKSRGGEARDDVASLAGKRFVLSLEADKGSQFAESLLKSLTGGDRVRARHPYGRGFEFLPQLKLWLAANSRPRVRHDDTAAWRRIVEIPFEVVIPANERDPLLKEILRDPAAGGRAILAWAVAGCLDWQRMGLSRPPEVEAATEAYRTEMDPSSAFFDKHCEFSPEAWTSSAHVSAAYQRWCHANAVRFPLGPKQLTDQLQARRCASKKIGDVRGWRGILLLEGA